MNRDHLRLVCASEPPMPVAALETFTFATVAGELVVLHNDSRCTAPEALVEIMRVVMPHLAPLGVGPADRVPVHVLPGDAGGLTDTELAAIGLFEPCALGAPRPICGETEGDMS